jgi:hypothetical protein
MHSNLLEPASVGTQRKLILHNLLARPDTTIQYGIVDCTDIELRVRVPTNIRLDTRGLIFAAIYSKSVLPVILSSICLFLRHVSLKGIARINIIGRTKSRRNNFQRLSIKAALRSTVVDPAINVPNGEPEPEREARALSLA